MLTVIIIIFNYLFSIYYNDFPIIMTITICLHMMIYTKYWIKGDSIDNNSEWNKSNEHYSSIEQNKNKCCNKQKNAHVF